MRTIYDLNAELHGSKYFTLVVAKSGYWMVGLRQRELIVDNIQQTMGKFRSLQIPFDLSVSSDVFLERLDVVIKTVPCVTGIAADVLAEGDSEINHDITVLSLLDTALNNNLKFSPDKIQFKTKSESSLGSFHPTWHEYGSKECWCYKVNGCTTV